MDLIARYRTKEPRTQKLEDHLKNTAILAKNFGAVLQFDIFAELAGLIHDAGKATASWQNYLLESVKGNSSAKIDHATAGAKILEDYKNKTTNIGMIAIQAATMFHHGSGLPDMISPGGISDFYKRLSRNNINNIQEIKSNLSNTVLPTIEKLISSEKFLNDGKKIFIDNLKNNCISPKQLFFYMGMHLRMFSSCLIDADRSDSAAFEDDSELIYKTNTINWNYLCSKLESKLSDFSEENELNKIRNRVSKRCWELGQKEKGIYTCSAFTGAGKTLASLRFALEQAKNNQMDHIFIIAPYTSIIDQNADVIRNILEDKTYRGKIVLECHSNLTDKKKINLYNTESDYEKYEARWNAPIIVTTMVQFLETLFGAGTKSIRRMHSIANSVLIFDEIQTLPIKATYLFNWGLQYLVNCCSCSTLLCTATQPCLDKIGEDMYRIKIDEEVIENIEEHFSSLKRVRFIDKTNGGREKVTVQEVCKYIQKELDSCISFLAVVNTKKQAKELFSLVKESGCADFIYHLSTNMCPAHRRKVIEEIRQHLEKNDKIVCISTRLIEAGIDLSFGGALRYLSGLDSIIQTAGRCNRNNELMNKKKEKVQGTVAIFSVENETISSLKELEIGQACMERVLREVHQESNVEECELMHPDVIKKFFIYYYSEFSKALSFSLENNDSSILDMLSDNKKAISEYERVNGNQNWKSMPYRQAFKTAWENFEVIADATTGLIVPFLGNDIIGSLSALEKGDENYGEKLRILLQEAQQYSVNVYSNQLEKLKKENMIYEVIPESGIYALYTGFYDDEIGLTYEISSFTGTPMMY